MQTFHMFNNISLLN